MTSNKLTKIIGNILFGLILILTTGCGQNQSFNSSGDGANGNKSTNFEDLSNETEIDENDLVEMVDQEQIVLMDENDVRLANPSEKDEGLPGENGNPGSHIPTNIIDIFGNSTGIGMPSCPDCTEEEKAEKCPINNMFGGIPAIDLLGMNKTPSNGGGGQCGDRASHVISIHGPNDTYVGVGPGNVEVSSKDALVCVAKDEIIVAVGDVKNNLENAASCGEEGEEKIHICQKDEATGSYLEQCLSKDDVYIFLGRQSETEKTYLGTCLQE